MTLAALTLAGSLAAGLGTLYPSLWFLAPLGLAALFYLLWFCVKRKWVAALVGFILGFACGGAGVWWMWDMYPIEGLLLPTLSQWLLIGLVWGITALLAGLSGALAAVVLFLLRTNVFVAIIASFVWVLQEELRMWLYALYSYSPESLVGPHFSQTAIGYALAEMPTLLHLSKLGGIAALNASVALIAAGIALWIHGTVTKRLEGRALVSAGVVFALMIVAVIFEARPAQPLVSSLQVAVLSASIETDATDILSSLQTIKDSEEAPDLVVLPEGSFVSFEEPQSLPRGETLVIGTRRALSAEGSYKELVYYANGEILATYRKLFLMPQGEYFPSIGHWLFSLAGADAAQRALGVGDRVLRGNRPVAVVWKDVPLGGLICSDMISPHLYTSLSELSGARILVNVSNPDWFHESRAFHDKMLQIARVHAVRTDAYFLSASVGAPSYVISPKGSVLAQSTWGESTILMVTIR